MYVCMSLQDHVCMYVIMYVCMYVCMSLQDHVCMCAIMYVCMYVCMSPQDHVIWAQKEIVIYLRV